MGLDPAREPREVKRRVGLPARRRRLLRRHDRPPEPALHGAPQRPRKAEAETAIDEVLEQVGLTDRADDRVETYSRGMRQRLGIADALVKSPDLLILDEPTTSIDPIGVVEILDLLPARQRARPGDPALEPPADPGPVGLRPDRDLRRRPADRGRDGRRARQPSSVTAPRSIEVGLELPTPADVERAETMLRGLQSVESVERPPAARRRHMAASTSARRDEEPRPPGHPRRRGRARPAPDRAPPGRAVARRHLPHRACSDAASPTSRSVEAAASSGGRTAA